MKKALVVEGKNDTNILKSFLDCDIIETNGTYSGKEVLRQIRLAQKTRGATILTDPDFPGEKICSCINAVVPDYKNAFIDKAKAKTSKKAGIEYAYREDILEALMHLATFDEHLQVALSYEEYLDLGLNDRGGSTEEGAQIARSLYLGRPDAKALLKHLNALQLRETGMEKLLGQPYG